MISLNSWRNAALDATIIGLKELLESETRLIHSHIYFEHCFNFQDGWKEILESFLKGRDTLYDLEFLQDEHSNADKFNMKLSRRAATFNFHAGYTGCAVRLNFWCHQKDKSLG